MARKPQQTLRTRTLKDGSRVYYCNTILSFRPVRDKDVIDEIERRLANGEYLATIIVSLMRDGVPESDIVEVDLQTDDFDISGLGIEFL